MKILTKEQIKKLSGKFLNVYPLHYHTTDKNGKWVTVYELRGTSNTIKENFQSIDEILNG